MTRHGSSPNVAVHSGCSAAAGSGDIPGSIGDMTNTTAPGEFSLVYLVYNAITCLLTQDQQVECFRNAARHARHSYGCSLRGRIG
jgi:hypothetical protein